MLAYRKSLMFALVLLAGTSTPLPAATTGSPFLDMIRGMATGG